MGQELDEKYKKIGWRLILLPLLILVIVVVLFAISSFIFSLMQIAPPDLVMLDGSIDYTTPQRIQVIIRIVLGFIGIVNVLAIIICFPLGIVFLFKKSSDASLGNNEKSLGNNKF